MLGFYVSLLMNMLTTWAFLIVDEDNLERWFRWFRAWVPPLTIVVMAVSSII
jgi:cytochrome bd-type quinol oxidase subunit 2